MLHSKTWTFLYDCPLVYVCMFYRPRSDSNWRFARRALLRLRVRFPVCFGSIRPLHEARRRGAARAHTAQPANWQLRAPSAALRTPPEPPPGVRQGRRYAASGEGLGSVGWGGAAQQERCVRKGGFPPCECSIGKPGISNVNNAERRPILHYSYDTRSTCIYALA